MSQISYEDLYYQCKKVNSLYEERNKRLENLYATMENKYKEALDEVSKTIKIMDTNYNELIIFHKKELARVEKEYNDYREQSEIKYSKLLDKLRDNMAEHNSIMQKAKEATNNSLNYIIERDNCIDALDDKVKAQNKLIEKLTKLLEQHNIEIPEN